MPPKGGQLTVGVSVKVRPQQRYEGPPAVTVAAATGEVAVAGGPAFAFAHALGGSDQERAYAALAAALVDKLRGGFDCTMLAYGQTGSGKTYTMLGREGALTEAALDEAAGLGERVPADWGLMPRTLMELVGLRREGEAVHASVIEIYRDSCYDLLNDKRPLKVGRNAPIVHQAGALAPQDAVRFYHSEDKRKALHGAHPAGCDCMPCQKVRRDEVAARIAKRDAARAAPKGRRSRALSLSAAPAGKPEASFATVGEELWKIEGPGDVARLSRLVEANRSRRGHNLNDRSSRSHCLIRVHFTRKKPGTAATATSKFLFVDLAGSERIGRSGVQGAGQAEAIGINDSLTTLGRVVNALVKKQAHVPYRVSPLTMLLRDSLAGKAVVRVVICVAAGVEHAEETACSLKYGSRMAMVKSAPKRAEATDVAAQARGLESAIGALRSEMKRLEEAGQDGRFGDVGVPSERRAFLENLAKHRKEADAVGRLKQELLEARARGDTARASTIAAAMKSRQLEEQNYHDIVLRQKMIRGFWIEKTPQYVKKEAELQNLEARLQLLGV